MSNQIGIRTVQFVPAGVTTISNTVLANVTGLVQAVQPNTTWWIRYTIPFTVGATGGVKFEVITPAAPTLYLLSYKLYQFGAPGTLLDANVLTAAAAIANAAAGAGDNLFEATFFFKNGANAGNIALQFAQNSSVAAALTIQQGGIAEVYQM